MKTWIYVLICIIFVTLAFYSTAHIPQIGRWIITEDKIYSILVVLSIVLYVSWLINKYISKKIFPSPSGESRNSNRECKFDD